LRSAGVSPASSGGVSPLDAMFAEHRAGRPVNPPASRLRYGAVRGCAGLGVERDFFLST
jgi:hypothetical protein